MWGVGDLCQVLTLTVVKAVRVVGYATMDVAAQCRLAARKFQDEKCTECSTEAMGLGLEALNAALSCAEAQRHEGASQVRQVTEVTAAELSREDANAEGYVGAAAPGMELGEIKHDKTTGFFRAWTY